MTFRRTRIPDLASCAELVEDRFLYGDAEVRDLVRMWEELLSTGTGNSTIVLDDDAATTVAFGISAFLSDEQAAEFQSYREPFICRTILRAWRAGNSPLLDEAGIAAANATSGVNIIALANSWRPTDLTTRRHAALKLAESFGFAHMGLNVRSFTHEIFGGPGFSPEAFGFTTQAANPGYAELARVPPDRMPTLLSARRDPAATAFSSSVGSLFFSFSPPRICLDERSRALLRFALEGATDAELANELNISFAGVKKRWLRIFEQFRESAPDSLGKDLGERGDGKRGMEMRQSVIAYVRDHPQELHPFSRLAAGGARHS